MSSLIKEFERRNGKVENTKPNITQGQNPNLDITGKGKGIVLKNKIVAKRMEKTEKKEIAFDYVTLDYEGNDICTDDDIEYRRPRVISYNWMDIYENGDPAF